MPSFATLWKSHAHVIGEGYLLDRAVYSDQCAINLSAAMMRAGIDFKTFRGVRSWQKDKPRYPIRAQELADWLCRPGSGLSLRTEKSSGKEAFQRMRGRTGIVFFQNYWGPTRQGDHIDLWNGARLTELSSWVRIQMRLSWEGTFSNMRNAESVWFWWMP